MISIFFSSRFHSLTSLLYCFLRYFPSFFIILQQFYIFYYFFSELSLSFADLKFALLFSLFCFSVYYFIAILHLFLASFFSTLAFFHYFAIHHPLAWYFPHLFLSSLPFAFSYSHPLFLIFTSLYFHLLSRTYRFPLFTFSSLLSFILYPFHSSSFPRFTFIYFAFTVFFLATFPSLLSFIISHLPFSLYSCVALAERTSTGK